MLWAAYKIKLSAQMGFKINNNNNPPKKYAFQTDLTPSKLTSRHLIRLSWATGKIAKPNSRTESWMHKSWYPRPIPPDVIICVSVIIIYKFT